MDIFDKATVLVEGKYSLVTRQVLDRAILLGSVVTVCNVNTGERVSGVVASYLRKPGNWASVIMIDDTGDYIVATTPLFYVSD